MREGWLTPAKNRGGLPPAPQAGPGLTFEQLMADLDRDREDRVIYLDSSVALAQLLFENRAPRRAAFWRQRSSLQSAARIRGLEPSARLRSGEHARRTTFARFSRSVDMTEMTGPTLARALEPFPIPVRTLDALHLATLEFCVRRGEAVELASYDNRLLAAARALGIPLAAL